MSRVCCYLWIMIPLWRERIGEDVIYIITIIVYFLKKKDLKQIQKNVNLYSFPVVSTWVAVMIWESTVLFCVFKIFYNENNRNTRSPVFAEAFKQRLYTCLLCTVNKCFLQEGARGCRSALTSEKGLNMTCGMSQMVGSPISLSPFLHPRNGCCELWETVVDAGGEHGVMHIKCYDLGWPEASLGNLQ